MNGRFLIAVTMLVLLAELSGCGRKTGLLTPYEAAEEARRDAEKAKQPLPPEPTPPNPDRPFLLDRLIQ